MPRPSEARLKATVDIMADEWTDIVKETGELTCEDMRKSLARRYYHGHRDFIFVTQESSLQRLNAIFIGDG